MKSKINRLAPWLALVAVLAVAAAAIVPSGVTKKADATRRNAPPPKLTATVSASGQVRLTASNGHAVTGLHSGWYTVLVRVSSSTADFHLLGPNVHTSTLPHFTGAALWGIHFLKGTYRYSNDHKARATTHLISVS